jgi:nucleoside-diphosphate-sugar epimerase
VSLHVIVGAGSVGSATARILAGRGDQVRVVSRRGGGPVHDRIERVAVDATGAVLVTTGNLYGYGLARMSDPMLRLGGLFSARARAFREVRYQFEGPFVLDSSAATAAFGLQPTPLDDALREMVEPVPPAASTRPAG